MPEYTDNLKLFKYNTETDGKEVFSINEAINHNWDILDKQPGTFEIGNPIMALSNTLGENEIWLEGAIVSRTTYTELFAIYGTTYGVGDGSTTFQLPDYRNKTLWGATDFGYISAGLPNIRGKAVVQGRTDMAVSGSLYFSRNGQVDTSVSKAGGYELAIDASRSSGVYRNDISTVQPPAIKHRVKTRYK